MNDRIVKLSLLSILVISSIPLINAQVYTERVDMLCPDFLLGSWFDFSQTRDWIHICPINEPDDSGGSDPVQDPCDTSIDTDQDGISDCTDQCIFELETVNFFEDFDGCPDTTDETPQPTNFLHLFQAFGNTIVTVPNTTHTDQKILIQWNNGNDMTITDTNLAESPFIFKIELQPITKSGSGLPLSQNYIYYDVTIPSEICQAVVTNDCIQLLRYEIPTRVTGLINGTVVQDNTAIVIDLTDDEFNPQILLLLLLLLIPLLGVIFRRRKKKKEQKIRSRDFLR